MLIRPSDRWHFAFPGAHVGAMLLGGVDNTRASPELDGRKRRLETRLRDTLSGQPRAELLRHDVLAAYRAYYKRFDQTYHVQLQLESVVHKGKDLPNVSPLVDAAFLAELDTFVLTASHDADRLAGPLVIDATRGGEPFVQMGGRSRLLKPDDMMMADADGPACTVLYGQDARSPVSADTRRVLFVCYAPSGVPEALVRRHLDLLRDHVAVFAPDARTEFVEVFAAGAP